MQSERTAYQRLRDFYQGEFRPVYDRFSSNGNVPQEIHAELAAAFDHLLRKVEDCRRYSDHLGHRSGSAWRRPGQAILMAI